MGFQLAAVFQPPLAALIQLKVAARAEKPATKSNATPLAAAAR
jgi:hypothetical protein